MKPITRTTYKVNDFLTFLRGNTLRLSPSFQRRPVWKPSAKSLLIDSIVSGIPMPIIFLRERLDVDKIEPLREVVDGQQRLRTIVTYIAPNLLPDYDSERDNFTIKKTHNKELAGKNFNDLDVKTKHSILNYEFSVHILHSGTEDREVLQIFARMNSNGVKANAQELRNAEYFGPFKKTCYDLAYAFLNNWREWRVFSENDIARMMEVEETSDLIILMHQGIHGRTQPIIDSYYEKFETSYESSEEVARRFTNVMMQMQNLFGDSLGATEFRRRGLFNALFTFCYDHIYGLKSDLKKTKADPLPKKLISMVSTASRLIAQNKISEELRKTLRGGTGNLESIKLRYKFLTSVYRGKTRF
jgi:hypothetical protein